MNFDEQFSFDSDIGGIEPACFCGNSCLLGCAFECLGPCSGTCGGFCSGNCGNACYPSGICRQFNGKR
ncbi:MAG: hypothetical protein FWG91_02130 [Lachnospiraceae bacterium]|nr:hypothetical protein [Lachnospiraceae bacterium]